MTVFITNEPYKTDKNGMRTAINMTPARKYGDLEVLIPAGASMISTVPMIRTLRDKLAKFSDVDYLIPVGSPASIMAAGAIAAEMNCGRIKILQWDNHIRDYIVIQVDTSGRAT